MKIEDFNDALLLSNKNVEKLARKYINESCNAVLMEMFEDKCLLADHTTGQIYEAGYDFDGGVLKFENFKEIELENDKSSLREAIGDYFDDKNINLVEAYESATTSTSDVFEGSLSEALASKNMDNVIDYSSIVGINEEVSLKDNKAFADYKNRIETNPMSNIKMFDWKNPVKVSVLDEDSNVILNKTIFAKAKKLRNNTEFKKLLAEAIGKALNDDATMLEELLANNDEIVALSESELKELVGMSIIGNKKLMDNRKKASAIVEDVISEDVALSEKRALVEAEKAAGDSDSSEDEDEAPEVSAQDNAEIVKALEKAKEKATDEKLVAKIDSLITSLEEAAEDESTDVSAVKEAVSLLSL